MPPGHREFPRERSLAPTSLPLQRSRPLSSRFVTASPHVRLLALIGPAAGERLATHTAGYPLDPSKMLPTPDVILLVTESEPGAMLFRYTAHGELAGDTLHDSRG